MKQVEVFLGEYARCNCLGPLNWSRPRIRKLQSDDEIPFPATFALTSGSESRKEPPRLWILFFS